MHTPSGRSPRHKNSRITFWDLRSQRKEGCPSPEGATLKVQEYRWPSAIYIKSKHYRPTLWAYWGSYVYSSRARCYASLPSWKFVVASRVATCDLCKIYLRPYIWPKAIYVYKFFDSLWDLWSQRRLNNSKRLFFPLGPKVPKMVMYPLIVTISIRNGLRPRPLAGQWSLRSPRPSASISAFGLGICNLNNFVVEMVCGRSPREFPRESKHKSKSNLKNSYLPPPKEVGGHIKQAKPAPIARGAGDASAEWAKPTP